MGNSKKSKASRNIIGNGPVTSIQIAYMVDRYLQDNGFKVTRSHFRIEASSLLSGAPLHKHHVNLKSLEELLIEYLILKDHKVATDQEKIRVQNVMLAMQNVMNSYKASVISPPLPPPHATAVGAYQYCVYPQYGTPIGMPVSSLPGPEVSSKDFPTPSASQSISRKRKKADASVGTPPIFNGVKVATAQEKSAANETDKMLQADNAANNVSSQTPSEALPLANKSTINELMTGQGASLAESLLNEPGTLVPTNSHCSTKPRKSASSRGRNKAKKPQQDVNPPTNSSNLTKGKLTISPLKQNSANIVSTSPVELDLEGDLFNEEFYSSGNYSCAALLKDLDLDCEGATSLNGHIGPVPTSFFESRNVALEPNQVTPENTSNVNQVIQEQDMNMNTQEYDAITFAKTESEFRQMLQGGGSDDTNKRT